MSCSNCYNGCPDIVSDQCVRYTGIDVPVLGIKNGDSLSYVEQSLITFLTSVIDGSGIKLNIDKSLFCDLVKKYLTDCEELTAINLFQALVASACDLQAQVDGINNTLNTLNDDYDVDCLPGVFPYSDTHDILQATITKLCEVDATLAALAIDLSTNYVQLADLNDLIQAYLDSLAPTNKYYNKMVPYTAVEYYGPLTNFDITGAGLGQWEKIYLCNGLNGTPDKRGRVPVGAIVGVGGGPLSPDVDPATFGGFNPNYDLYTTTGSNAVLLNGGQIPVHTHTATAAVIDPMHTHDILGITGGDNSDNNNTVRFAGGDKNQGETGFYFTNTQACQPASTGITVDVTVNPTGGGLPHTNNQPALGCYYIIYLP